MSTNCPTCTHGTKRQDQIVCNECHNPNRPTSAGYCAQCGYSPCLWLTFSRHYTDPQPLTREQYETRAIAERIDALTNEQRRDALVFISGGNAELLQRALAFIKRD